MDKKLPCWKRELNTSEHDVFREMLNVRDSASPQVASRHHVVDLFIYFYLYKSTAIWIVSDAGVEIVLEKY